MTKTIKMKINKTGILKNLSKVFTDRTRVIGELLQNARRAGATRVYIQVLDDHIHIKDNGAGIRNFAALLDVGGSGWSEDIRTTQNPYGMGFMSALYACESIGVSSQGTEMSAVCADVLAGHPVQLQPAPQIPGTFIELAKVDKGLLDALEATLKRLTLGLDLAVYLNGEIIQASKTPKVLLDQGFMAHPFEHGTLYLHPSSYRTDTFAFLQGLPLTGFAGHDQCHVVHFNENVDARMPDRDKLYDHDVLAAEVKQLIKQKLLERLISLRQEMNDDEKFVAQHGNELYSLDKSALNEIDALPSSWLSGLESLAIIGNSGFDVGCFYNKAIRKTDLAGFWLDVNDSISAGLTSHDSPFWLAAYLHAFGKVVQLNKGDLDSEHWIYELPQLNLKDVMNDAGYTLVNPKNPECVFLGVAGHGVEIVHCDEILFTGPLGSIICNDEAFYSAEDNKVIVGSRVLSGEIAGQICDFTDDWGDIDSEMRDVAEEEMRQAIIRTRETDEMKRLQLYLRSVISTDNLKTFAGQTFALSVGEEGEVSITAVA